MTKRYQVFVSSTYKDLVDERKEINTTLMKMNHIPAGMELFPAIDLEQFQFIKKIIDDSDYYIIVLGGKYGSVSPESGISYTEMEYDYAVSKKLRVIALIHKDINKLSRDKTEEDPALAKKLDDFKKRVATNRVVIFWENSSELIGHVALSLSQTIGMFPAEGWVRAGEAPSEELLMDLNNLRKENSELKEKLHDTPSINITDIADLSDSYVVRGEYTDYDDFESNIKYWEETLTWGDIFSMIGPVITTPNSNSTVMDKLATLVSLKKYSEVKYGISLDLDIFNLIKVQMMCYGFVEIYVGEYSDGSESEFWKLTDKGKLQMMSYMAVKK